MPKNTLKYSFFPLLNANISGTKNKKLSMFCYLSAKLYAESENISYQSTANK